MELKFRFPWSRKAGDTWSTLREFLQTNPGKSGINVTWKTALEATTALACARVIGEGLAQVPLKIYQSRGDGRGSDVVRDHSLYGVLHDSPNEWQTSYDWRESMALHLVLAGDSLSVINRVRGEVRELIPYAPGYVEIKRDGLNIGYEIKAENGQRIPVSSGDMFHVRGPSWNTWSGLDGVRLAREAIGLSLATEEHGARMFGNGATVGGILSTDQNLSQEQIGLLKKSWDESQSGLKNAYKTAVLFGGMKYSPRAQQNDQAQWIEVRRFQVMEVCRAFRVLPIMVGEADKTATYASSEQMFLAHVVHTMGPWYTRIEQALNKQLLTQAERERGLYTKFTVAGLLRGAHKDRAALYTSLYNIGAINPNEIREMEEMNPYEGGDEYRVPLNMAEPGQEPTTEE